MKIEPSPIWAGALSPATAAAISAADRQLDTAIFASDLAARRVIYLVAWLLLLGAGAAWQVLAGHGGPAASPWPYLAAAAVVVAARSATQSRIQRELTRWRHALESDPSFGWRLRLATQPFAGLDRLQALGALLAAGVAVPTEHGWVPPLFLLLGAAAGELSLAVGRCHPD